MFPLIYRDANEDFAKTDFSHENRHYGRPVVKVMQDVVDKMNVKEITIVYGQLSLPRVAPRAARMIPWRFA